MNLILDTREPDVHPWTPYFPAEVRIERDALETGDMCLAGFEDSAVVERKTASDFLGCIGSNRIRFERELMRSRYIGHFCIIIESSLPDVLDQARGLSHSAIIGTIAAWTRRYCPIIFAGNAELAAKLALRWLMQPIEEAQRVARMAKKAVQS